MTKLMISKEPDALMTNKYQVIEKARCQNRETPSFFV